MVWFGLVLVYCTVVPRGPLRNSLVPFPSKFNLAITPAPSAVVILEGSGRLATPLVSRPVIGWALCDVAPAEWPHITSPKPHLHTSTKPIISLAM